MTPAAAPHILIDLTPLRPGGVNGGAKPLALALIDALARLAPACRFTLLTPPSTHDELASLDRANLARLCPTARPLSVRLQEKLTQPLARRLGATALFCPFTAPVFHAVGVPTASLVHDLQFLTFPEFFSHTERRVRSRAFRAACSRAAVLVCPSDYVRCSITAAAGDRVPPIEVIPHSIHQRFPPVDAAARASVRRDYGLGADPFLLYPANFWPHKNHETLLRAFALLRRRADASPRLVLTGEPGERHQALASLAADLGLSGAVFFTGYLPLPRLAALFAECAALVFPSLYEGFGMPVLEAMHFGRPVLCSRLTALPEVAGGAALYFDPLSPAAIAGAMETVLFDDDQASRLAQSARESAAAAPPLDHMARRYLALLTRDPRPTAV